MKKIKSNSREPNATYFRYEEAGYFEGLDRKEKKMYDAIEKKRGKVLGSKIKPPQKPKR